MFGIGKQRSKFGKWLDKKGIKQIDIERATNLSRPVISDLANNEKYNPTVRTRKLVVKTIKDMGYEIKEKDFWL